MKIIKINLEVLSFWLIDKLTNRMILYLFFFLFCIFFNKDYMLTTNYNFSINFLIFILILMGQLVNWQIGELTD